VIRIQALMHGRLRGSGLHTPRRRTFAAAIPASAHSMLAALRHPWLRSPATPALSALAAPR